MSYFLKRLFFTSACCLVSQSVTVFAAPDMDLFGGPALNVEISEGDTSPRTTDFTDWGDLAFVTSGNPVVRNFKITNGGNENLLIIGSSNSNTSNFTVSGLPTISSPITPGASRLFQITFDPSTEGQKNATIGILNTSGVSGENPFEFAITGNYVKYPKISVRGWAEGGATSELITNGAASSSFANGTYFGTANTGEPEFSQFKVYNTGLGPLTIVPFDDSDQFSHNLPNTTIAPSDSLSFFMTFEPTSKGTKSATFTIANNDPDEAPFTFTIAGMALEPDMSVRGGPGFTISNKIDDGDTLPRASDGTDMGIVDIDGGTSSSDFQIINLDDGNLNLSSAKMTGPDAADFSLTGVSGATPPMGYLDTAVFTVTFDPTTAEAKAATVSIESNDPDESPYTFAVRGVATGTPAIEVEGSSDGSIYKILTNGATPIETEFGTLLPPTVPGASVTHFFRATNTGTDTLTLSGGSSGGGFLVTGVVASLEPGQSDDFQVRFSPTDGGVATGTISLDTNVPGDDPFAFSVEGTGDGPEIELRGGSNQNVLIQSGDTNTSSLDGTSFDNSYVNQTTSTSTFAVKNRGFSSLSVSNISLSGADPEQFSLSSSSGGNVPAGGTLLFDITYAPTQSGISSALVTITNDDFTESDYTIGIRGYGANAPDIDVLGARPGDSNTPINSGDSYITGARALNFPEAVVGDSSTIEYTVENNGTSGVLNYSVASDNPDFQFSANAGGGIQINSEETFSINFVPSDFGEQTATITITSNDPNENPYTFTVAGAGFAPDIKVTGKGINIANGNNRPSTSTGADFGDVIPSSTGITRVFRIENVGNLTLQLGSTSMSGDTADFTFSGLGAASVNPGNYIEFPLTFDPISVGQKTITIQIDSDDPNEDPFTFDVTGNGEKRHIGTPDLVISGNGVGINAGDLSPSITDGTDFGSVGLGAAIVTRSFTMTNIGDSFGGGVGSGNVTSIIVSNDSPDVTISSAPASLVPSESRMLTVNFSPSTLGLQTAVISVASNDPNENPYTFAIQLQVDPPVEVPPAISEFSISGSGGTATFETVPGKTYTLTTSTTMASGSWAPISGVFPISGTGNSETFSFDVNPDPQTAPLRYYRIEVQ